MPGYTYITCQGKHTETHDQGAVTDGKVKFKVQP